MTRLQRLEMTAEIRERVAAVERALDIYRPGRESASAVELPKLALADAVMRAIRQQTAAHDTQLAALPKAAPVTVSLRPKRRRRA